jgi:CRP/FNR family transcriptional regulator, cyclic AMP receptor protein
MQAADPSVAESLLKTQLFSGLSATERNSLGERAIRKKYSEGERLFAEGDPCQGLFVVVQGAVRIFKSSPNGREQVLAVEGPGSSIAELPVFDGGDYPASATAVGDTSTVFISGKNFRRCVSNILRLGSKCYRSWDPVCGA